MPPTVKKNPKRPQEFIDLRRRAEAQLGQNRTLDSSPQKEADTLRLIHELEVHQIELEMQNLELQQAHAEVETLLERYTDLYDFAPVGYFTFGKDGTISQVNLCGARMLGLERSRVVNRRFGLFLADGDMPLFNKFLENVFVSKVNQACELTLSTAGIGNRSLRGQPNRQSEGKDGQTVVQIEAKAAEDGQTCRAVMIDITERKRNEVSLRILEEQKVHRIEDLEAVTYIAVAMRQAKTRSILIPSLVNQSIRALKSQTGILALIEGESLVFTSGTGSWESLNGVELRQGDHFLWNVVRSGRPRVLDNLFEDNQDFVRTPLMDNLTQGLGACIIAPIIIKEFAAVGLLLWGYSRSIVFSVDQMRLVTAIINIAGSALHRMIATEAAEKMASNRIS